MDFLSVSLLVNASFERNISYVEKRSLTCYSNAVYGATHVHRSLNFDGVNGNLFDPLNFYAVLSAAVGAG